MQKMIKILLWMIVVATVVYVGVVGWRIYQFYFPVGGFQPACSRETKTCDDGSVVGRIGNTCDLADCPEPRQITEDEAGEIAARDCIKEGETVGDGEYDEDAKSWRFSVTLKEKRKGCQSDCLVRAESGKVKIDWRCPEAQK